MKLEIITENNWLEATWYTEVDEVKTQVHCESFSGHKEHIEMLIAKAKEFDTSLDEYEDIIKEVSNSFIYPTQEELDKDLLDQKIQEAKDFLSKTDYKMLPSYVPKEGEDMRAVDRERFNARKFIRDNK